MLSDYQWLINNGIAVVVVVFIGFVVYRVLVGSKATGYQGVLVQWLRSLTTDMHEHFDEQTTGQRESLSQHKVLESAIAVLVDSESPPVGAAFLAASAVHNTAKDVKSMRKGMQQSVKICRLIAQQFPDIEKEISIHCDELDRIIGHSGESKQKPRVSEEL